MPPNIKCPICSAWTLVLGATKMARVKATRYECGNGHRFRIEADNVFNGLAPRHTPPQANFNTPQAQRWAEKRGAA